MHIFVAAQTANVDMTRPVLDEICNAIEFQLYAHVAAFWQTGRVSLTVVSDIAHIPTYDGACPIILMDKPDQAGVLGWHTYSHGRPFGYVFMDPILQSGGTLMKGPNSVSATLSHEAIEAAIDPYINDFSFVNPTTIESKEACDRCEGDSYQIGSVTVSNFLGPRAFRDGPGPYDWLRLMKSPWEVRPGGYVERINVTTGKSTIIWGPAMSQAKRDAKLARRAAKLSRPSRRAHIHGYTLE